MLLAATLLLTGCSSVRINRILADPARYNNRTVRVEGRVVNVIGALNTGLYEVDDGTGRIFVVSARGVPTQNAHVKVDGYVQPGLNVMGRTLGTAIKETGHRVRF